MSEKETKPSQQQPQHAQVKLKQSLIGGNTHVVSRRAKLIMIVLVALALMATVTGAYFLYQKKHSQKVENVPDSYRDARGIMAPEDRPDLNAPSIDVRDIKP